MLHCLIGVASVDVKQSDLPITEIGAGLVKSTLDQPGKTSVEWVAVSTKIFKHLGPIKSGVRIAFPGIYTKAPRTEIQP
jgi:hypothetical protein